MVSSKFLGYFLLIGVAELSFYSNATLLRPLTSEDKENMVFVQGMWFSKDSNLNLPSNASPKKWFSQCMNHEVEGGCNETWRQRYWDHDRYYAEGGPVFFMLGGEFPADQLIDYYYWQNYGREYSAKMVVLEHRFYGFSFPTRDNSYESLQLLTSQQALADAAYFMEKYSKQNGLEDNKWIVFGGSYAGNLAAWFKQKYPNHVVAAVASSGPLEALYDFPGYLGTASKILQELDPTCYETVFEAFSCMETLINGTNCGEYTNPDDMLPVLHQCDDVVFEDQLLRETFFGTLAMEAWGTNYPTPFIQENCAVINALEGGDALEVYGDFLQATGEGECISRKMDKVHQFVRSEQGKWSGAAGWLWQTCYEFGYYMSADPGMGLFGYDTFSGDPWGSWCLSDFGSRFTRSFIEQRLKYTNEYYKGKAIDAECVIFVNGGWDPWHPQGINDPSETSPNNTVVYTPKGGHCDDMLEPQSEEMRQAQAKISEQIGVYLNKPMCQPGNRNV